MARKRAAAAQREDSFRLSSGSGTAEKPTGQAENKFSNRELRLRKRSARLSRDPKAAETARDAPEDDQPESSHRSRKTNAVEESFSPREIRRKRREELKSKATGLGVTFVDPQKDQNRPNKRITFNDQDLDEAKDDILDNKNKIDNRTGKDSAASKVGLENLEVRNEKNNESSVEAVDARLVETTNNDKDADDDDDDEVEEVKGEDAKAQEEEKQAMELASSQFASSLQPRPKRKRKESSKKLDSEEFDEDFFRQLDLERAQKKKPSETIPTEPKGRRTTFVAAGDDSVAARTEISKGHNIHVVVLPDLDQSTLVGDSVPSESVIANSRDHIMDGSDVISAKQKRKLKKSGKKDGNETAWKRSRKMTILASASSYHLKRQRRGQGIASPQMVLRR